MENRFKPIFDEVIKIRRYLHTIPEIGFEEFETSRFISEKLEELGFRIERVAGTGVVGFRKGKCNRGAIAFRADMDALRVVEKTGVSYSSKNRGVMHACGHDGHMAILLGLAMCLSQYNELERDIILIFQPAEEGPGGAKKIVEAGIFEKYNVEAIFGLHILPDIEEGKIGVKSGALMATTGEFDIKIKSKGGHGAMPHTATDGIYVASQLINSFQSIISRNIEPIEGAVLTIGKIQGGEARNIIAEDVVMEGTIRAFDNRVYNLIKDRMNEISSGIEKMYNVKIDLEIRDMYPSVINDDDLYQILVKLIPKNELVVLKPMMISEDFSFYQRQVPGLFFMLGSRNEELGYNNPLHNNRFNFNEEILEKGIKIYLKICSTLNVI